MSKEIYSKPSSNKSITDNNPAYPLSRSMLADIEKEIYKMGNSFFAGFHGYPRKIKFESQDSREQIILLLRRHFITNITWILITVLLSFIPLTFSFFGILNLLPSNFQLMTYVIWYLFVLAYFFENILTWLYNVYIITDERVVDVDFVSLVYKHISETKIDKIEDVTYEQGGLFQSFFDSGTVAIQTAAEEREFEFEYVSQPSRIAKVLNQLIIQEEQEKIEGRVN